MQQTSFTRRTADFVLVCCALKQEVAPFRRAGGDRPGVSILVTGIGRQNAEGSLRKFLVGHLPKQVFTCGFAGGLNPELKLGDVIFELSAAETPSAVHDLQSKLIAAGAKPVNFFCADRIAITVAEKKRLRQETGADAVEMESAAIHAVCRTHCVPCATVRAISDVADVDLPLDFNRLAKPDRSLDYGKLLLALATTPQKTSALMTLRTNATLAAGRLAAVLAAVICP